MQNNLAILISRDGILDEAKLLAQQAIDFWVKDRERFPEKSTSLERLATALNTMGEIRWRSKFHDAGDESFANSESLFRLALERNRERPETQSRLAGVLHNRSFIAYQLGDVNLAIERIESAIEYQSEAVKNTPASQHFRQLLKSHRDAAIAFSKSTNSIAARSEDPQ